MFLGIPDASVVTGFILLFTAAAVSLFYGLTKSRQGEKE